MFDFLKKQIQQPPLDIESLTTQLNNALRSQIAAGNITAADLQKIVRLAYDGQRLRDALKFL